MMAGMTSDQFVQFFGEQRGSAILRTDIEGAAIPAMEAAVRGGFRVVEFTMTTPDVLGCIAAFRDRDDVVVGAGTVLTVDDAEAAVDAGARFLVSPVVDEVVIEAAARLGVAAMPGCHTPTEMLRAHRAGAPLQKLFPAAGIGAKYIKACLGPLPMLRLVPTNGVHENNVAAYMKAGAFAVGFVGPLFDGNDLANGRFDRVEERAKTLFRAIRVA